MMGTGSGVQIRVSDRLAGDLIGARHKGGSCKHKETGEGGEGVRPEGGLGMSHPQAWELKEKDRPIRGGRKWRRRAEEHRDRKAERKGQQGCKGRMDRESVSGLCFRK